MASSLLRRVGALLLIPFAVCAGATTPPPAPQPGDDWVEWRSGALGIAFSLPPEIDEGVFVCGMALAGVRHAVADPYLPDDPPRDIFLRQGDLGLGSPGAERRYTEVAVRFHANASGITESDLVGMNERVTRRIEVTTPQDDHAVCLWTLSRWGGSYARVFVHLGDRLLTFRVSGGSHIDEDFVTRIARGVRFFEPDPPPALDPDGWFSIETGRISASLPRTCLWVRPILDVDTNPEHLGFCEIPSLHHTKAGASRPEKARIVHVSLDRGDARRVAEEWRDCYAPQLSPGVKVDPIATSELVAFDMPDGAEAYRLEVRWTPAAYWREWAMSRLGQGRPPTIVTYLMYFIQAGDEIVVVDAGARVSKRRQTRKLLDQVVRTISVYPAEPPQRDARRERTNDTASPIARSSSSLTMNASYAPHERATSISRFASANRFWICASSSRLRECSRSSSAPSLGGMMKIANASGILALTCRAPSTSISRITNRPRASCSTTQSRGVPYFLPNTSAHSKNSSASIILWNCSSVTKR
ncbi:MAG: hypothetical protein R3B57_05415 [Phycisphaerales bacterium]